MHRPSLWSHNFHVNTMMHQYTPLFTTKRFDMNLHTKSFYKPVLCLRPCAKRQHMHAYHTQRSHHWIEDVQREIIYLHSVYLNDRFTGIERMVGGIERAWKKDERPYRAHQAACSLRVRLYEVATRPTCALDLLLLSSLFSTREFLPIFCSWERRDVPPASFPPSLFALTR